MIFKKVVEKVDVPKDVKPDMLEDYKSIMKTVHKGHRLYIENDKLYMESYKKLGEPSVYALPHEKMFDNNKELFYNFSYIIVTSYSTYKKTVFVKSYIPVDNFFETEQDNWTVLKSGSDSYVYYNKNVYKLPLDKNSVLELMKVKGIDLKKVVMLCKSNNLEEAGFKVVNPAVKDKKEKLPDVALTPPTVEDPFTPPISGK